MHEIILKHVSSSEGIEISDILGSSQFGDIVQARQICHYLMRLFSNSNLTKIGTLIGNKDHSTVLHSISVIENMIETNHIQGLKAKKYYTELVPVIAEIKKKKEIKIKKELNEDVNIGAFDEDKLREYMSIMITDEIAVDNIIKKSKINSA